MVCLKTLREERAKLGGQIRKMADTLTGDKKDFNAEEKANWERLNKDYDDTGRQIEIESRAAKVLADLDEKPSKGERRYGSEDTETGRKLGGERLTEEQAGRRHDMAFQAWARRQAGMGLTAKQSRMCKEIGFNPNRSRVDLVLPRKAGEVRALSVGTGSAGGFLVPTTLVQNLERAMKSFNGVRQSGAEVMRTPTGAPMNWPTGNDTSNTGELVAENAAVDDNDVKPTFAQTTYGAYKYSSKLVRVPYELLEDSDFDLATVLGEMLGERIGRIQNTHFTTGDGSSKPTGIVTGSTLGKTAASATAIAADELIDLYHSIDPAYRNDPSFGWMMHDSILAVIRKLKDSQNQYLWQPGLRDGVPETLLSKPVTINMAMQATVATATKTVLCGAMRYMKIRDVNRIRLRRLEEVAAVNDQVCFIAFLRSDAKVLNAGGNPIKHLVQA
jgi:HK97 family phage major capsid protein